MRSSSVQSALKRACLARDRYRCVITGEVDPSGIPELDEEEKSKIVWGPTQCAHIIPYSIAPHGKEGIIETWQVMIIYIYS